LSFSVIQKFETLMQKSIKEVINIHKCKFFIFLILCGLARAGRGSMWTGPAGSLP